MAQAHVEAHPRHHVNPAVMIIAIMAAVILILAVALGVLLLRPGTSSPTPAVTTPVATSATSTPGTGSVDQALAAYVGNDKPSASAQPETYAGAQEGEAETNDGLPQMTDEESAASRSNLEADLANGYKVGEIDILPAGGPGLRNFRWRLIQKRQDDGYVRPWVEYAVDVYSPPGTNNYVLKVEANPGTTSNDISSNQSHVYKAGWGYDNGSWPPIPRADHPSSVRVSIAGYN
jgi:hypothetical protein